MKKDLEILQSKFDKTVKKSEGEIHKKLKFWIAKKYLVANVPVEYIEFEYKLARSSHEFTIPDVFIKQWGNIAVYCEITCRWEWLRHFFDDCLPILEENTMKQVVVFPQNVRALYPRADRQYFFEELKERNIDVYFAPYYLDIEKKITIQLSYDALNVLKELKNKHSKVESLDEFIKNELENLCVR